jgi:hypothetical protein
MLIVHWRDNNLHGDMREVVPWPPHMYNEFIVAKAVWLICCIDGRVGKEAYDKRRMVVSSARRCFDGIQWYAG